MVAGSREGYSAQIKKIKKILLDADVPQKWYSINKASECRISVVEESDGIHVFVPERGERVGNNTYTDWYQAVKDVAESFELRFTEAVMEIAEKEKEHDEQRIADKIRIDRIAMNRRAMIAELAKKTHLTLEESETALNGITGLISECMAKGEKVSLPGFGTFETKNRPARITRHPRTGAVVKIAACKAPVFKAGKALKDKVNAAKVKKSKK